MGKRLPYTPTSKIRAALRQLFLRSRERAACLKTAGYKCSKCGVKQSMAKGREVKVQVHHKEGILNWAELFEAVRRFLLVEPGKMEVLCEACHEKVTAQEVRQEKRALRSEYQQQDRLDAEIAAECEETGLNEVQLGEMKLKEREELCVNQRHS